MVAAPVKKRQRFEKWHYDFARVIKQVMKEHGQEIDKQFKKTKRREENFKRRCPDHEILDDNRLLMTTVFLWIIMNGTEDQKRITFAWVDNMKKISDERAKAPVVPMAGKSRKANGKGVQAHG